MGYVVWLMSVGGWIWTVAFLAVAAILLRRDRRPHAPDSPPKS